jgi:hypothetical protein
MTGLFIAMVITVWIGGFLCGVGLTAWLFKRDKERVPK